MITKEVSLFFHCPHCAVRMPGKSYSVDKNGSYVSCSHCGRSFDVDVADVCRLELTTSYGAEGVCFKSIEDMYYYCKDLLQDEEGEGVVLYNNDNSILVSGAFDSGFLDVLEEYLKEQGTIITKECPEPKKWYTMTLSAEGTACGNVLLTEKEAQIVANAISQMYDNLQGESYHGSVSIDIDTPKKDKNDIPCY